MEILLNGVATDVAHGATLIRLLDQLDLSGKRIAVECNGEIVPASRYANTTLAQGDAIEIVIAVGGG